MRWLLISVRVAAVACYGGTKRSLVGGALVAALLGASATAAEFVKATPPPAPPNWSGPYIGLSLGTRTNAVDANVTSATVGGTPIPLPPLDPGSSNPWAFWQQQKSAMQFLDSIALRGGIYAGWNFQVAPNYVVGVEGDLALANETAVFHGSPYPANLVFGTPNSIPFGATHDDNFKVSTRWDGSMRARSGWLPLPNLMLYLTLGLAWANLQATSTCSMVPTPNVSNCAVGNYFGGTLGPAVISHTATKVGWTAGIGAEMLIGRNWVARTQYRFSDFGYPSGRSFGAFTFTDVRTCTGCPASANPLAVSYELLLMQHIFEVGVAYKF